MGTNRRTATCPFPTLSPVDPPFEDIPRKPLWWRLFIGSVLVIFATAAATAVAAFHEVNFIKGELNQNKSIVIGKGNITPSKPGAPETILLLGSDKRPKGTQDGSAGGGARSDTIILLRLDPRNSSTTMLSLPRDLKVNIPGHGTDKINAAYQDGGPALTLKTVKQLMNVPINHVVNVDFQGFKQAVNALGCIYGDIDRRYFNNTVQYAYINVQPGYQRLCGEPALEYARFRHEDTDLLRGVRQQDLLLDVKQQAGLKGLFNDRHELTRIVGRFTTSDKELKGRAELIRLFKLAAFSASQPIRQLTFDGHVQITSGDPARNVPSYVIASPEQVARLRQQFLRPAPATSPTKRSRRGKRHAPRATDMESAPGPGRDQALQAVQQGGGGQLPVYYPAMRRSGSLFIGPPRVYKIRTPGDHWDKAYRMVAKMSKLGEYYGIQGTTWRKPPVLDGAADTVRAGRRTFEVRYDGDRVATVAWRTPKAVYWVVNTLTQSLSKGQMLAIARSTRLP
jgi:LCP family protein required for cell wall assembly